jgi:hypothetical protein
MEPDAVPEPQPVPPRVIAGGGIGDGPVDGVVNVYAIDDTTRRPIANATVRVGTLTGTTDADGLFVARDATLTGAQTITVKAAGYRSDVWIGANGGNVTFNLQEANTANPPSATLTVTINGFAALAPTAGHVKVALATYSQTNEIGEAANEIEQNDQNVCISATACNMTVRSRTGNVAIIAAIFDRNLNGTPNDPNDDTQTFLTWAHKGNITVAANVAQTVALDVIPDNMQQMVTASFGTTPSGLSQIGALVGIEGPDGILPLAPMFLSPAAATMKAPKPEAIASTARYQLIGIASDGATNPRQSIVLRRGLTGTNLSAGTWLDPPTATPTRTGGSFTPAPGATAHSFEYSTGSTLVANVSVFDGSTQVTLPDLITLPSSPLTVVVNAIGAPGLDVNNFSLDAERDKLSMVAGHQLQLP